MALLRVVSQIIGPNFFYFPFKPRPAEKQEKCISSIHSKSEKVCGFYFSISKNLRKKCVNRDNDKSANINQKSKKCIIWKLMSKRIKKCVYHDYMLCKTFLHTLVFEETSSPLFLTYCRIDIFCILRKSFCGKFQIVCGFYNPANPAFRMYGFLFGSSLNPFPQLQFSAERYERTQVLGHLS